MSDMWPEQSLKPSKPTMSLDDKLSKTALDARLREIAEFAFNRGVGATGLTDINDPDERDKAYLNIQRKTLDEATQSLKQAFADEGYIQAHTLPRGIYNATGRSLTQISGDDDLSKAYLQDMDEQGARSIKIDGNTYYRGQEWYDRFEKEADSCTHYIRSLFREGYPGVTEADHREMFVKRDILEAAKRAAGLETK